MKHFPVLTVILDNIIISELVTGFISFDLLYHLESYSFNLTSVQNFLVNIVTLQFLYELVSSAHACLKSFQQFNV